MNDERSRRVVATANRLRLVQIDFADQTEQVRREYLTEEVRRALASVAAGEREAFLGELQQIFPTWDGKVELEPRRVRSDADEKELKDPGFLVARLAELAPAMPEAARHAAAEKLRQAGLFPPAQVGWSPAAEEALRAKLQLTPTQVVTPDRAIDLLGILQEFAAALDKLVWTVWRQVAPEARVQRTGLLQKGARGFLVGDAAVTRAHVLEDVERLRKIIAAMVSAIGQIGRGFASDYASKFAPPQVEDAVRGEGGGVGSMIPGRFQAKCWDRYTRLWNASDAATIEKEINQAIVAHVERLIGR